MPRVTFMPAEVTVDVTAGTTILEAGRTAGVEIPASCGGKGLCGKCRVRVTEGETPASVGHEHALSPAELVTGWRLACIAPVENDIVVELPTGSTRTVILTDFGDVDADLDTDIRAVAVEMPEPSLEDQLCDVGRLKEALGSGDELVCPVSVLRELPKTFRENGFKVNALLRGEEIIGVESPGDDVRVLGLAVDVGTTTIAGVLVDLRTGENLATASRANPQATHGDDVISRIDFASEGLCALRKLQLLAAAAINEIAFEAATAAGLSPQSIYDVVVAGNTTMHHLLLGLPPEAIGTVPFIAVQRRGMSMHVPDVGVDAAPGASLYAMANISGYVGGDITAGLLAHRIHERDDRVLYIDIGTNGEMALRADGVTWACSTAAGPAFEGARISCGMRAASGAINTVSPNGGGDVVIETVDDETPRGICGTGLLDAVAALLDLGVVDETGRFADDDDLPDDLSEAVKRRLDRSGDEPEFILSDPDCDSCPRVTITQQDLREVQLAKGAIAAGTQVMLDHAGVEELDAVMLAGAFGSYLRPASARRIGLLPSTTPVDRISSVGNAALAGARTALVDRGRRLASERLAGEVRYIELSGRPDFQTAYMTAMMFPDS